MIESDTSVDTGPGHTMLNSLAMTICTCAIIATTIYGGTVHDTEELLVDCNICLKFNQCVLLHYSLHRY